ncbi:MAG TPA: efflux RND transporter periplasmic adaptor subunit [Acidiferrobacteraceae bacterium]|nr:efflux RND transporter periplasmic adaptor subunit [Acidiferrobacteraceae bacterium]
MKRSTAVVLWSAALLAAGFAMGREASRMYGTSGSKKSVAHTHAHAPKATAAAPARRVLYWVSPMNPHERSNHFKRDSMNMAYVPVYAPATPGSAPPTGLAVDPRMVQTLGVRLVRVQPRLLNHQIRSLGTITLDENRRYDVTLRTSGWIRSLKVRAVGDVVRKGQVLARLYAPALYAAESEYLIARDRSRTGLHQGLTRAAAQRLRVLGFSRAQIKALAARGHAREQATLRAPASGTVLALGARAGGYVHAGTTLFKLADLRRVWARIALYSYQLPWVQLGDRVELALASAPGHTWHGRIGFLYPTLDPQNRTVEARVPLSNRRGLLRPGMYVRAQVEGAPRTALAVPADAVLHMAGTDYVMQATGHGHFLPTQVRLGASSGGWVQVRRGLSEGDRVAESAQFLLYAESQLQQVRARMLGPTPAPGSAAGGRS